MVFPLSTFYSVEPLPLIYAYIASLISSTLKLSLPLYSKIRSKS